MALKLNSFMTCAMLAWAEKINGGIHCSTKEEAESFLSNIHRFLYNKEKEMLPVKWDDGTEIDPTQSHWEKYKEKTVYVVRRWDSIGLCSMDNIVHTPTITYERITREE